MRISEWNWLSLQEWGPAFVASISQAVLSASAAFVLGFVMFCGLQWWTLPRGRVLAEISLLFPNVVPPLFLVMSMIGLAWPLGALPQGIYMVVVAHALMNAGLVAVALDRLVHFKLGGLAETAWVLGASPKLFWHKVGWPYLRSDLSTIYLFVFSLCFTSFSIPLMLSGERPATLEVAIYDILRLQGRWDKAVLLAALQSIILLVLAGLLPQAFWPQKFSRRNLEFLGWKAARVLPFLPGTLIAMGWMQGLGAALSEPAPDLPQGAMGQAIITTALIAFSVGALHLFLFFIVATILPHESLTRFLNGYLAPSPAITGFGLVLVPLEGELVNLIKLVVALTLISFPLLYRWLVHTAIASLHNQVAVARAMGAGWVMIFLDVVWPQAAPQILRACGVAALWAAGDFALSGILLSERQTLPLIMEDLLGSYQIGAAQMILLPLAVVGLLVYAFFRGASRYVAR